MFEYIVVQAGGKGTRMEQLTKNKPKALVPVNNLPILFHLFRKYPDKKYVIIGDYKYDVLDRYLNAFSTVNYKMVNASGHSGTCAGLQEAVDMIPDKTSFLLIHKRKSLVLIDLAFSLSKIIYRRKLCQTSLYSLYIDHNILKM